MSTLAYTHVAVASLQSDLTLCGLVLEGSDGAPFPWPIHRIAEPDSALLRDKTTCTKCARRLAMLLDLPVTYVVPEENRKSVEDRIDKLNRRAAKLGVPPVLATYAHDHTETWKVERVEGEPEFGYVEHAREWIAVTLAGTAVRLPGWRFLATLHHTTDGNIIAAVPGFEVPREYRNAPSACHHCRTTRRRNATYLVRADGSDKVLQVGRDCLQDFLGGDPHAMAAWAEALGAFASWFTPMEEEDRRPRNEWSFSLAEYLRTVVKVIRKDGWVSKKLAQESDRTATATLAWGVLTCPPGSKTDRENRTYYAEVETDAPTTDAVLAWAEETFGAEGKAEMNDYEHNLSVVVRSGIVNMRVAGLAASIVQAWRRATQVQEERKANAALPSVHVGTVGERLRDLPVTVAAVIDMPPTDFGPRQLIKFRDDAGNLFVWFTGSLGAWTFPPVSTEGMDPRDADDQATQNRSPRSPTTGDRMWMTGTVKKHSSFAGAAQTEMTRCALASVAPTPKKVKKSKKEVAA